MDKKPRQIQGFTRSSERLWMSAEVAMVPAEGLEPPTP